MATRSQVPTPGWRRLSERDLLNKLEQSTDPSSLPESDDDAAFISKHNDIAEEERERWAGVSAQKSMKKVYAATKGSTSKSAVSKRSRANLQQEALYPKPMESFLLVEEAKKAYLDKFCNDGQSGDKREELRRNLTHFIAPIQSLAAIEDVMQKQMDRMKQLHSSRLAQPHTPSHSQLPESDDNMQTEKTQFTFDDGTKFELASHAPVKRRRRSTSSNNFFFTPAHQMPDALDWNEPEKKGLDVALIELAMERIVTCKENFKGRTVAMYNAGEDILKQADWKLPKEKSFVEMSACFQEALKSGIEAANNANQTQNNLAECIKLSIDSDRYPVVADAFKLSKDYRLDGCDLDQSWISKMRKLRKSRKKSKRSSLDLNSEDHHVSSHGFSLPMYAFDSDEEMDVEIGNPLLEDVWIDVRKRLARKRSRKINKYYDDFFAGIEHPEANVKLTIQTIPNTLRRAGNLELVHPDDKRFENSPTPKTPNGTPNKNCNISIDVALDDDDDDELEELDLPPPDELVNTQKLVKDLDPLLNPTNANSTENSQPITSDINPLNGTGNTGEDSNLSPVDQDTSVPELGSGAQATNMEPFIEEFDITSSQEEVGHLEAAEAKIRDPKVANRSEVTNAGIQEQLCESEPTTSNIAEQGNTIGEQGSGDRGLESADIT